MKMIKRMMTLGQQDRRAAHQRLELGERDHRAREGDRADDHAEPHLEPARPLDRPTRIGDPELGRVGQRRRGDEHRRHADQAVEGGDQLRHRRHPDLKRDHHADRAADRETHKQDQIAADPGVRQMKEREQDRDRHAGDADQIAPPGRGRRRQPAQGQDEADRGDQVAERDDVRVHASRLSRAA
jgi:hypothetical protein